MPPSFTQALDDLYTTTWQKRLPGVFDNIFQSAAFWYWLKDKGKIRPMRGGRFLEVNLQYGKNTTTQWITRGGTVAMNDFKFLTVGQYNWRYLVANILRFWIDEQQNSSDSKIVDWVNAKLDNTEEALVDNLETALTGGSPVRPPTRSTGFSSSSPMRPTSPPPRSTPAASIRPSIPGGRTKPSQWLGCPSPSTASRTCGICSISA
jgi:hypothetical protein